jgi:hypothetical protein
VFKPDSEPLRLRLLQSRSLGDRCLLLRYQPAAVAALPPMRSAPGSDPLQLRFEQRQEIALAECLFEKRQEVTSIGVETSLRRRPSGRG